MSSERVSVLRAAASTRSTDATARVRRALAELTEANETITFTRVATHARVSRQFLYGHPDLREEIARRRSNADLPPARPPSPEPASHESLRVRLRAALDEHKRLRDEIASLREELALALGRARELEHASPNRRTT